MYLPISILAFILNGIAVTVDKFLLTKVIPDPLLYVFYFSLVSFLAVFLLPFTHIPNLEVAILASVSTAAWTVAAYFMFRALKIGQVTRVIPVIGTLNPLILFVIAVVAGSLLSSEIWAVLLLISGLIFLTINDWQGRLTKSEVIFEILSASLFAFSYYLLREAYLKDDVVTVLVWSRFVLIPLAFIMIVVPVLRVKVLPSKKEGLSMIKKGGGLFAFGQVSAGISQLLIFLAISLASPVLVNSLQGIQYIFLFIMALFLAKKFPAVFGEKYSRTVLVMKLLGLGLIAFGLYLLAFLPIA